MFCTKCGTQLEENAKFCTNCGTTVENDEKGTAQTVFTTESDNYGGFIDSDVMALVGDKNTEFYNMRFNEIKQYNKKITWNWPAFLVGPLWLFYRKMYSYGIAFIALSVILEALVVPVVGIAVSAVFAVFANYIYLTHLEKLSLEAKQYIGTAKDTFIKEKGGTSAVAILVAMAINMVLTSVLGFIFW